MNPARRIADIRSSPIRIISDGAPPDAIPLGLGEPSWDIPDVARRALAATSGPVSYGPNMGIPELRRAIAQYHGAQPDEVLVTCGSQGALYSLTQGWLDPGDELLIPDPGFASYPALGIIAGVVPVTYPLAGSDRFRLDASALVAVLDAHPRARAVILNHPSNPTGGGATTDALRIVADACRSRDVLLISDEVYRDLYFETRPPSLRDVSDYGVVVSSVSKGWGSPGLRIGWAVGDPRWLAPARTVHSYAVTSVAIPAQRAATALVEASSDVLPAARREIGARWDAFAASFARHFGKPPPPKPDGAFYVWLPLPAHAIGRDPIAFALELRDRSRVVIVPGTVFGPGGREHARVSFAARPEQVAEGIRRLAAAWA